MKIHLKPNDASKRRSKDFRALMLTQLFTPTERVSSADVGDGNHIKIAHLIARKKTSLH